MRDRPDGSAIGPILRALGEEISDVGEHLLRYEEGVVARFATSGGTVAATDLQRLDLSIQVLEDLRAVTDALAEAVEADDDIVPAVLLGRTRLERTRRRFDSGPRSPPAATVVELF